MAGRVLYTVLHAGSGRGSPLYHNKLADFQGSAVHSLAELRSLKVPNTDAIAARTNLTSPHLTLPPAPRAFRCCAAVAHVHNIYPCFHIPSYCTVSYPAEPYRAVAARGSVTICNLPSPSAPALCPQPPAVELGTTTMLTRLPNLARLT